MAYPKHYRDKKGLIPALHQTINAGGIFVPSSCLTARASSEHSNGHHLAEDVLGDCTVFDLGVDDTGWAPAEGLAATVNEWIELEFNTDEFEKEIAAWDGDSTVAGHPTHDPSAATYGDDDDGTHQIPAWVASSYHFDNYAEGSQDWAAIEADFVADTLQDSPQYVVTDGGLKDIRDDTAPATVLTSYQTVRDLAIANDATPILLGPVPAYQGETQAAATYKTNVESLLKLYDTEQEDNERPFADSTGQLNQKDSLAGQEDLFDADKNHLNKKGYRRAATSIHGLYHPDDYVITGIEIAKQMEETPSADFRRLTKLYIETDDRSFRQVVTFNSSYDAINYIKLDKPQSTRRIRIWLETVNGVVGGNTFTAISRIRLIAHPKQVAFDRGDRSMDGALLQRGFSFSDDFVGAAMRPEWLVTDVGAATTTLQNQLNGVVRLEIQTNVTSDETTLNFDGNMPINISQSFILEFSTEISVEGIGGISVFVGLRTDANNRIGIESLATGGGAPWNCITENGGTETSTDSTLNLVAEEKLHWRIVCDYDEESPATSRIRFYCSSDGEGWRRWYLLATHTTNVPIGNMEPYIWLLATSTATRGLEVDYYKIIQSRLTKLA